MAGRSRPALCPFASMLVNLTKTFKYSVDQVSLIICEPGVREIPAPYCDVAISIGFGVPAEPDPPSIPRRKTKRKKATE